MNKIIQKPNVFIVGAARSATTSIVGHLKFHSEVYIPGKKEPGYYATFFFKRPRKGKGDEKADSRVIKTWDDYVQLYSVDREYQVRIDASTEYLYYPKAAEMIKGDCQDAKIIICLRHPVERAYSAYNYMVLRERETLSFEQALEQDNMRQDYECIWRYFNGGLYYEAVKHYIDVFGKDNVKIVFFENFTKDVQNEMNEIFEFIGVEPINIQADVVFNKSGKVEYPKIYRWVNRLITGKSILKRFYQKVTPKHKRRVIIEKVKGLLLKRKQPINADTRKKLLDAYNEDIEKLSSYLDIDLSHWSR